MSKPPYPLKLSPELVQSISRFFFNHDLGRLNRNLRRVLMGYLGAELYPGVPNYLEEMIWQLGELFELIDEAAEETKDWPRG
jgi:hypothetical protein